MNMDIIIKSVNFTYTKRGILTIRYYSTSTNSESFSIFYNDIDSMDDVSVDDYNDKIRLVEEFTNMCIEDITDGQFSYL